MSEFLTYKDKPLVKKGNTVYFGDMSEKYVIRFDILTSHKEGDLEVADKIKGLQLKCEKGNTELIITLPAGNEGNLNPELLLTSLFENGNNYYCYIINRTAILDANGNLFR